MFVAYCIVAVVIIVIGFAAMWFYFMEADEPETFVEGLRIVSMFTAGSWLVALLWPVLLASVLPVLFIYGLWRLWVEGRKEYKLYREKKVKATDV
jgi:hypothetical protein